MERTKSKKAFHLLQVKLNFEGIPGNLYYRYTPYILSYSPKTKKVNEHMIQFGVYCTNNEVLRYNDVTFTLRYKCTSNHVSTGKIRSKPYLHIHDFSRWPPFDIGNIFINFVLHVYWYEYCYSIYQVSCQ